MWSNSSRKNDQGRENKIIRDWKLVAITVEWESGRIQVTHGIPEAGMWSSTWYSSRAEGSDGSISR